MLLSYHNRRGDALRGRQRGWIDHAASRDEQGDDCNGEDLSKFHRLSNSPVRLFRVYAMPFQLTMTAGKPHACPFDILPR